MCLLLIERANFHVPLEYGQGVFKQRVGILGFSVLPTTSYIVQNGGPTR